MQNATRKDYRDLPFIAKELKPHRNYKGHLETFCEMPQVDKLPSNHCTLMYDKEIKSHNKLSQDEIILLTGQDRRVEINEQLWPFQMIVQLTLEYDNDAYGGTGIFIGPYHILTAGHCIFKEGKWADKIYAFPGRSQNTWPFGVAQATKCYILPGWLEGNEEDDMALIVLDEPLGLKTGWAGMSVLPKQEVSTKKLFIAGYPGDKGFKDLWGMKGLGTTLGSKRIIYDIDTEPGQSGSGVCFMEQNNVYVVGVHARGRLTYNEGTRITEERLLIILGWMSESYCLGQHLPYISVDQGTLRDLFHKARRGWKEELDSLEKIAMQGNARALFYMSCLYYDGIGVERDINVAKEWLNACNKYGIEEYQEMMNFLRQSNNIGVRIRSSLLKHNLIRLTNNNSDSFFASICRGIDSCSNGDRYEGDYISNKRHGRGTIFYVNGDLYDGEFMNDKCHGKGVLYFADNGKYEGNFVNGKQHGDGVYYGANGEKYEGAFRNNKFHGKGIYYFLNGDKYVGDFVNNKRHGKGLCSYADGTKYEGDYAEGNRHGKGICTFRKGNRYEGDFQNDKCHGKGTFYYTSGNRYEGIFAEDKRQGKGTRYFPNGGRYEVEYVDDKRHGEGIGYYADHDGCRKLCC